MVKLPSTRASGPRTFQPLMVKGPFFHRASRTVGTIAEVGIHASDGLHLSMDLLSGLIIPPDLHVSHDGFVNMPVPEALHESIKCNPQPRC